MDLNIIDTSNKENRPGRLLVLCILSWVNIGFSLVISAYQLLSGPTPEGKIIASQAELKGAILEMRDSGMHYLADVLEKFSDMTAVLNNYHYEHGLLTISILIFGLIGVSFMFLGKKLGFHLYIIYSILSLGQLYVFFSASEIPSMLTYYELIISGIFIALYSRSLIWMK